MKKILTVCAAGLMAMSLAACDDATAKLKGSGEPVLTVGKTKITKGDLYESMFAAVGEQTAINGALKVIEDAEVETTDDMLEEAQSTLDYYKTIYGEETFASYLEQAGMTEDDFINNVLLVSQKETALYQKYVEDYYDDVVAEYNPLMATVLTFSTSDDADAALTALKDGTSTAADLVEEYSLSNTGESELITIDTTSYDTIALSFLRSASVDDGWTKVPGSSTDTWYVLRVDETDPEAFKDTFVSWATQQTAVQSEAKVFYYKKYGFHVYDINLYNAIDEQDSSLLVQKPTPTPTATAEASASASADASAEATEEAQ
jgi:foldase protein PrsA